MEIWAQWLGYHQIAVGAASHQAYTLPRDMSNAAQGLPTVDLHTKHPQTRHGQPGQHDECVGGFTSSQTIQPHSSADCSRTNSERWSI
jgi:hypothetical protein